MISTRIQRPNIGKVETGILKIILSVSESPCTRIISKLYKDIFHPKSGNTCYIKEKWEKEGNVIITEDAWKRICLTQWTSTCSTSANSTGVNSVGKMLLGFLLHLYKRNMGEGVPAAGDLYWQEIHKHINNIFGVSVPFTIDTVYMGDIQFDGWRNKDKKLV